MKENSHKLIMVGAEIWVQGEFLDRSTYFMYMYEIFHDKM